VATSPRRNCNSRFVGRPFRPRLRRYVKMRRHPAEQNPSNSPGSDEAENYGCPASIAMSISSSPAITITNATTGLSKMRAAITDPTAQF
jgi:hypothetical protein